MKLIALLLVTFSLLQSNALAAKILFFGDSHSVATVGPFGVRMNQLLRSLPNSQVETHARCGSVMSWWYSGKSTTCGYFDQTALGESFPPSPVLHEKWAINSPTPKIIPLIESFKPDLIVVEMGGNYMYAEHPLELAKKEIGNFIADLEKTKSKLSLKINCVWIGPPSRRDHMDEMPPLVKAIRESVEPFCTFIDSTTITTFPTNGRDGIHYSFKEGIPIAREWAEKAFLTVKAKYE